MKIAYLSTFYPFRGGIAQFNASIYNELAKNHSIEPFTFTTQYPNLLFPGQSQFVQDHDEVDIIPSIRSLNTINPLTYYSTSKKILNLKPELLITKFWMPFFGPSLGFVAGKVGKKAITISILDNVIPHEQRIFDLKLVSYFLQRNDGFVVMSNSVKNDLLQLKPNARYIFKEHPLYNHFGIKVKRDEACRELKIDPTKKILLFFGFIRDYKGLDILLEGLSLLDNSYHLIIAGECYGDFNKYDKLIKELGISGKVSKFVRYINDKEVSIFFSASDVCMLPYKSATQSGIISIAYHFDLPVIANHVGGLHEMIKPHNSGTLVQKADPNLIAISINDYFDNSLFNIYRENILSVKKELSWSKFSTSLTEFANELKDFKHI